MKIFSKLSVVSFALMLSACAATPQFAARPEFWSEKDRVIGVAIAKPPAAAAHKQGQQGLLDLAINAGMANELDAHLNKLDTAQINELADRMVVYLKGKGYNAKRIADPIDVETLPKFEAKDDASGKHYAAKDFSVVKKTHGVDKVLLLSINAIGTIRSYYGFVPLGAPQGISNLSGQVVNLQNNSLEWNQAASQVVPNTEGEWDMPPSYPGLTKAVNNAFEQSRNMLYNQFAQ